MPDRCKMYELGEADGMEVWVTLFTGQRLSQSRVEVVAWRYADDAFLTVETLPRERSRDLHRRLLEQFGVSSQVAASIRHATRILACEIVRSPD